MLLLLEMRPLFDQDGFAVGLPLYLSCGQQPQLGEFEELRSRRVRCCDTGPVDAFLGVFAIFGCCAPHALSPYRRERYRSLSHRCLNKDTCRRCTTMRFIDECECAERFTFEIRASEIQIKTML
jgi:hypothetical protein